MRLGYGAQLTGAMMNSWIRTGRWTPSFRPKGRMIGHDRPMRLPFLFIFAVTYLTPGAAQITHVHADAAEKPAQTLPPPVMIAGVGDSHLAITTSSSEAQLWFDQ